MEDDLFVRIKDNYDSMTKAFQRTSDFILSMRERILLYSANTLASHIGVSDATIIRFCQHLGFEGYNDFKRALVASTGKDSSNELGDFSQSILSLGSQHEYIEIALQYEQFSLNKTIQDLSVENISSAITKMEQAKRIFFLGLGSSAIPAQSLYFSFDRLQLNCSLLDFGGNAMMEKLTFCSSDDVLVVVTFPRYSTDSYNAVRQAKAGGACVILISDGNSDKLSGQADIEFVVPSKNPYLMYNSNVSALALCNILVLEYCYRHYEDSKRILKSITEKTIQYKL